MGGSICRKLDCGLYQGCLKLVEGWCLAGSPQPGGLLTHGVVWILQQSLGWICPFGFCTILGNHRSSVMVVCGFMHVDDSSDLVGVWWYTVCTDDVMKEADGGLAKLTLLLVQGVTSYLEALEGSKMTLLVLLLVLSVDNDAIHQAQNTMYRQIAKNVEVLLGTGDTKCHHVNKEATKWGDESCQMAWFSSMGQICQTHCWHPNCWIPWLLTDGQVCHRLGDGRPEGQLCREASDIHKSWLFHPS